MGQRGGCEDYCHRHGYCVGDPVADVAWYPVPADLKVHEERTDQNPDDEEQASERCESA